MKKINVFIAVLLISSSFLTSNAKEVTLPLHHDLQAKYQDKDVKINPSLSGEISTSRIVDVAQLLDIAVRHNPQIHKEIIQAGIYKVDVKQAKAAYTPYFQFSSGYDSAQTCYGNPNPNMYPRYLSDFMYGRISVSQLLYDFGYTPKRVAIAKDQFELAKIRVDNVLNNLIFDIKDRYYYLAYTYKKLQSTDAYYNELKAHRKLIVEHYKNENPKLPPVAKITDDATLDFRLALCEKYKNDANADIELAQVKLKNLTGQPYSNNYQINKDLSPEVVNISPEALINIANTHRPELKYAKTKIEIKSKNIKLVKKEILPTVNLFASYGLGGAVFERAEYNPYGSYRIGAMLSTPFVNPVLYKQKLEEAKLAKEYELADGIQVAYDTYLEIQDAYINYYNELKNLEKAKIALIKTKKICPGFVQMYKVGGGCYVLVADYTYEIYKANLDYYNTLYRLNRQKAALDRSVGKTITIEDCQNL